MEPRSLKFLAESCAGEIVGGQPELEIQRICTDSRASKPGDLFVALAGEQFDGHNYVDDALGRGAAAALIELGHVEQMKQAPHHGPLVAVENSRAALGKIAARYRAEFGLPIIAVAGSNGKTTAKDLIAAVLREKFRTVRSQASFNNEIGVPLTLLEIDGQQEIAVIEAGTNHPGELAPLLELIKPTHGVLTSVGREHLEFFGDLNGVIEEESALARALPPEGKFFVNGDSPETGRIAKLSSAQVVRVGFSERNDWRAYQLLMDETGLAFQVHATDPAFTGAYKIPLLGAHQAINAMFAIALGREFGLSRMDIQRGLSTCPPPKMRLQLRQSGGVKILDDAYNANADSMRAALETLKAFPCGGRRVAVLGEMAELGKHAEAAHQEIGRAAATVDELLAVGKWRQKMGEAARQAGLAHVSEFEDASEAAVALKKKVRPGDVVLVKASRAAKFERVTEFLMSGGSL